jgi:hypothetical protein
MTHFFKRFWQTIGLFSGALTAGLCLEVALPRPSFSAEEIRFYLDGPFIFSLSVESLETFAETGEVLCFSRIFCNNSRRSKSY